MTGEAGLKRQLNFKQDCPIKVGLMPSSVLNGTGATLVRLK
jgi:hypothetical protein